MIFNSYLNCIHIYQINIDKKWIVFIVLPSESKIYKFCTFGNSHSSNHDDFVKFISKMSSKEWKVIKMNSLIDVLIMKVDIIQ